jgi:hypothetical protein
MRTQVLKHGYRVYFTESDSKAFSATWPCSTVKGFGRVDFNANGDLVEIHHIAATYEAGSGWSEFVDTLKRRAGI